MGKLISSIEEIFREMPLHDYEDVTTARRTNSSFFSDMEAELGGEVEPAIKMAYCEHDMSSLSFADIGFGAIGRHTYLESLNSVQDGNLAWWGDGEKPQNFYCIALGEEDVVFLNVLSGFVYHFDKEQRYVRELAQGVEEFLVFFSNLLWRRELLPDIDKSKINVSAYEGGGFWNKYGFDEGTS